MPAAAFVPAPSIAATALSAGARIGIDLVEIDRIAASVREFGDRFTQRLFAPGELRDCAVADGLDAARLARRFAAKEATIKAFDLSLVGLGWTQIEMTACDGEAGRMQLHGRAAESAARFGAYEIAVTSCQHDGLACAIVVALPRDGASERDPGGAAPRRPGIPATRNFRQE